MNETVSFAHAPHSTDAVRVDRIHSISDADIFHRRDLYVRCVRWWPMSAYDDLILERRAYKRAEVMEVVTDDYQPSATSEVKVKAWFILGAGVLICAAGIWTIGIAFALMGVLWLAATPKLQVVEDAADAEQQRQQAAGTGHGCAANLWAALVGGAILLVCGLLAFAIGAVLIGGGR